MSEEFESLVERFRNKENEIKQKLGTPVMIFNAG
jgi:hypothetical protein